MLRKRLITVLTFNDGVLFRTKLFVPDYRYTLNFVDAWSADEIVILDVTRPGQGDRENFLRVVSEFASRCFVPLSVGGGIRTLDDVKKMMAIGADKVVLNTGALERPGLIPEIAALYGSQSIILSIDVKKLENGRREVAGRFATWETGRDPLEWATEGERLGIGEILLTPVERDGWLQGYDLEYCRRMVDVVNVPVLLLGGAGNWKHMAEGLTIGGAAGVCTQNIYHFTETSIRSAKKYLHNAGIPVRV